MQWHISVSQRSATGVNLIANGRCNKSPLEIIIIHALDEIR
jgi:hypothetical protein